MRDSLTIKYPDQKYRSMLFAAVLKGNAKQFEAMLQVECCSLPAKDSQPTGPPRPATIQALSMSGWENMVSLIDKEAAKRQPLRQETLLHVAVRANSLEMLRLLLRHGASADEPDAQGLLPLQSACIRGASTLLVNTLLTGFPSTLHVTTPDKVRTLLHIAAFTGNLDLTNVLLQRGIKPTAMDATGATAESLARVGQQIWRRAGRCGEEIQASVAHEINGNSGTASVKSNEAKNTDPKPISNPKYAQVLKALVHAGTALRVTKDRKAAEANEIRRKELEIARTERERDEIIKRRNEERVREDIKRRDEKDDVFLEALRNRQLNAKDATEKAEAAAQKAKKKKKNKKKSKGQDRDSDHEPDDALNVGEAEVVKNVNVNQNLNQAQNSVTWQNSNAGKIQKEHQPQKEHKTNHTSSITQKEETAEWEIPVLSRPDDIGICVQRFTKSMTTVKSRATTQNLISAQISYNKPSQTAEKTEREKQTKTKHDTGMEGFAKASKRFHLSMQSLAQLSKDSESSFGEADGELEEFYETGIEGDDDEDDTNGGDAQHDHILNMPLQNEQDMQVDAMNDTFDYFTDAVDEEPKSLHFSDDDAIAEGETRQTLQHRDTGSSNNTTTNTSVDIFFCAKQGQMDEHRSTAWRNQQSSTPMSHLMSPPPRPISRKLQVSGPEYYADARQQFVPTFDNQEFYGQRPAATPTTTMSFASTVPQMPPQHVPQHGYDANLAYGNRENFIVNTAPRKPLELSWELFDAENELEQRHTGIPTAAPKVEKRLIAPDGSNIPERPVSMTPPQNGPGTPSYYGSISNPGTPHHMQPHGGNLNLQHDRASVVSTPGMPYMYSVHVQQGVQLQNVQSHQSVQPQQNMQAQNIRPQQNAQNQYQKFQRNNNVKTPTFNGYYPDRSPQFNSGATQVGNEYHVTGPQMGTPPPNATAADRYMLSVQQQYAHLRIPDAAKYHMQQANQIQHHGTQAESSRQPAVNRFNSYSPFPSLLLPPQSPRQDKDTDWSLIAGSSSNNNETSNSGLPATRSLWSDTSSPAPQPNELPAHAHNTSEVSSSTSLVRSSASPFMLGPSPVHGPRDGPHDGPRDGQRDFESCNITLLPLPMCEPNDADHTLGQSRLLRLFDSSRGESARPREPKPEPPAVEKAPANYDTVVVPENPTSVATRAAPVKPKFGVIGAGKKPTNKSASSSGRDILLKAMKDRAESIEKSAVAPEVPAVPVGPGDSLFCEYNPWK